METLNDKFNFIHDYIKGKKRVFFKKYFEDVKYSELSFNEKLFHSKQVERLWRLEEDKLYSML